MSPEYSKRRAALELTALSVIFLASFILNPGLARPGEPYFTLCAFKLLTGLPCPACGLAHSFCALARGRLSSALEYNMLGPLLFVIFILLWLRALSVLVGRPAPAVAFDGAARRLRLSYALVILFTLFGAARVAVLLAGRSQ